MEKIEEDQPEGLVLLVLYQRMSKLCIQIYLNYLIKNILLNVEVIVEI